MYEESPKPKPKPKQDYSELGRRAMRARWGEPRRLNLRNLDDESRRIVLSVVRLAEAAAAAAKPDDKPDQAHG